ncbi:MAG: hypothetical protein MJZ18_02305 [Bacteroidales bacterium]|nr:hypothetical protein [Bacteroidales bacterium]
MNKKMDKDLRDVIKAARKGNREAEQEILGPGFHSNSRVHKSAKTYTRKNKHKGRDYNPDSSCLVGKRIKIKLFGEKHYK